MGKMHHKHVQRVENLENELSHLETHSKPTAKQARRIARIRNAELPKARLDKKATG